MRSPGESGREPSAITPSRRTSASRSAVSSNRESDGRAAPKGSIRTWKPRRSSSISAPRRRPDVDASRSTAVVPATQRPGSPHGVPRENTSSMSGATALQTLPALLDAVAARHPSNDAFIGARRRLSYAELRDDSIAIGRGLAALGVGRGTRVGLLMPNRAEWLASAFGVWRCGGVLVPLSTLARPRESGHCLESASVAVLLAVRRFLRHDYEAALEGLAPDAARGPAPVFDAALPALRQVVWLGDDPAEVVRTLAAPGAARGDAWPGVLTARVAPADPATVTFTSGTTSEPKGAVHAHRALCRSASDVGATLGVEPSDRTWGYLPFFFNAGLVAVGLAEVGGGAGAR